MLVLMYTAVSGHGTQLSVSFSLPFSSSLSQAIFSSFNKSVFLSILLLVCVLSICTFFKKVSKVQKVLKTQNKMPCGPRPLTAALRAIALLGALSFPAGSTHSFPSSHPNDLAFHSLTHQRWDVGFAGLVQTRLILRGGGQKEVDEVCIRLPKSEPFTYCLRPSISSQIPVDTAPIHGLAHNPFHAS
jgi:hypothetical protein